jgi:hypothetical protein
MHKREGGASERKKMRAEHMNDMKGVWVRRGSRMQRQQPANVIIGMRKVQL